MPLCWPTGPPAAVKLIRTGVKRYRMVGENDKEPGIMALTVL